MCRHHGMNMYIDNYMQLLRPVGLYQEIHCVTVTVQSDCTVMYTNETNCTCAEHCIRGLHCRFCYSTDYATDYSA
jgi:hypothetical protein